MTYAQVYKIALTNCLTLQPHCKVVKMAGSVRRKKGEVKDIEIVVLPILEDLRDMFGNVTASFRCKGFIDAVFSLGTTLKGKAETGRMMQIALMEGITLDLFIPEPHDFYRVYAIRTGSADYSAKVIAGGWKRLGWCGTADGLRRVSECTEKKTPEGKSKWVCTVKNPTPPPVWDSEEAFFRWLNVPFLAPEKRTF